MLGRTVFHVFNSKMSGEVISIDGESVRILWSDGRTYSHDRKFLCDEFSDLDISIKSRTVARNEEDNPDAEFEDHDQDQTVFELGCEPIEQERHEEEIV